MFFYLGNKVDLIDEKIRVNRNAQKSWDYGYNTEYDVIIISKDGTLGPIFHVHGINIGLPDMPTERKEFINWDKTEKNQKWKQQPLPSGLNEETQYNEEFKQYILQEIKRRKYGVWIYIKGHEVYMPGLSYYLYQWCQLDEGYPNFRIIQNELMMFWEACKADNRCYGISYVKNRRFGWSTICEAEMLYSGTTHSNKKLGIVSKTNDDAKEMFDGAFSIFKRLPCFLQPSWDEQTLSRIILKASKKGNDGIEEGLDSYIRYYSTALNSMDGGKKVFRSALDEVGKFPKNVPFNRYWKIVKTSHRQGTRIVGKSMVGSTVNALKNGGAEFKSVFDDSNPEERNGNGQTASGLYRLFISAEYGLEGMYDVYGFSIVENPEKPILTDEGVYKEIGSKKYLENELKSLEKDPDGHNEQLRQFPRTIREAFRDESNECSFNLSKILEQSEHNSFEHNHNDHGSDIIERGNFTWKDGIQDTEVIWRPDPKNGRFWIKSGCHPPMEFRNQKEMKYENGVTAWAPIAAHIGAFGADPYNRDKGVDGRGSQGAIHLQTKYNTSSLPNNEYILEYLAKPNRVEDFFEDMIMVAVYYSMPLLGELSNEAFLEHLRKRGYRHFSLNNPFKNYNELSPTERKLGGVPPQGNLVADQQFYAIEAYIEDYVGIARDERHRPIGTMGSMVFNRTLTQWKDVDLTARTKYDAYISSSLAALANQKRVLKKEEKKTVPLTFQKYDNRGHYSKAI